MKNPLKFIKDRIGTDSVKWDLCSIKFKRNNLLPMWVADMDISTAPMVVKAIKKRAQSGVFGYTFASHEYKEIITNWIKKQNNWEIQPNWIHYAPGVGSALYMLIRAMSEKNDNIIVQTPVYYVFFDAIEKNGRNIVTNELILNNGKYEIDFKDFEEKAKISSMFIMSHPHNPVGRVWSIEELTKIGEICIKHNVHIISDEVHSDLTFSNTTFTSMASISKEISQITSTCSSPSKTFNVAGLQLANIIIENSEVGKKYHKELELIGLFGPNAIASEALKAAYTESDNWLKSLLAYFEDITYFVDTFLKEKLPKVKLIYPEATYLLWLDFRELGLSDKEIDSIIFDKCKLALDEGHIFGKGGSGFMRINVATSRKNVEHAMKEIYKNFKDY